MSPRKFSYAAGVAFTAAGATCWSLGGALVRLTENVDAWQIIFYRSLAVLVLMGLWMSVRFRGSLMRHVAQAGANAAIAGIAVGTAGLTFVAALFYTTVAEAIFMVGISPFLSAILGFWILRERIPPITWAAMTVALAGMAVIFYGKGGVPSTIESGHGPKFIAHSAVIDEVWETLAPALRYLRDERGNRRAGTLETYFDIIRPADFEPPRQNPWRHSERFQADGFELVARESEHVPGKPSCSLEIGVSEDAADDRIAWWSGDCTVDSEFLKAIEPRTTVFFHDCTFVDYPGQVHGFFDLLAALPERVRSKMVLMHHEDDIEANRALVEAAGFRVALPGHAYDLESGRRIE